MLAQGTMFRCPVCGAEITQLRPAPEGFLPRCCNVAMVRLERQAVFYRCPVCGAEVAALRPASPGFFPRCCNTDMQRLAA